MIVLRPGGDFCEGAILDHGILSLPEKAFACMSFSDSIDELESKIPQTDFPQYKHSW